MNAPVEPGHDDEGEGSGILLLARKPVAAYGPNPDIDVRITELEMAATAAGYIGAPSSGARNLRTSRR